MEMAVEMVVCIGVMSLYTLCIYLIQRKAAESCAALKKLGKPTILVSEQ